MNPSSSPQMDSGHALIYGRLSKGDSALESHEARNLKYLELQGFNLAARFEDADTSGGIPIRERVGAGRCSTGCNTGTSSIWSLPSWTGSVAMRGTSSAPWKNLTRLASTCTSWTS